jgi:pyruvate carboxylase
MSGVVVEVRVKEGQEIKKGDPIAGTYTLFLAMIVRQYSSVPSLFSHERHEGMSTTLRAHV